MQLSNLTRSDCAEVREKPHTLLVWSVWANDEVNEDSKGSLRRKYSDSSSN